MKTLQELLPEIDRLGEREAVLHRSEFRTRRWTYRELYRHASGIAAYFDERELARGDRVLLWGENRPEWLAVFWALVGRGIIVVPMDFRSSGSLVARVHDEVEAKLLIHGSRVDDATAPRLAPELANVSLDALGELTSEHKLELTEAQPSEIVQIIYTSGTTGDPKGIVHRHRNLVANLTPIHEEARKFAKFMRPFQPIRTLDLLPLSHVFGQFMGLFAPVVLGGAVAFMDAVHPAAIIDTLRQERISVLAAVPRILSTLRGELEQRFELAATKAMKRSQGKGVLGGLRRWWQHRDVHTALGWKFWAILSGGARLPTQDEAFWHQLGLVLVQGYGMTETSSMVTTNHPLHPKSGSLGKVVGNQEIKLAADGEILVRGDNVSLETWTSAAEATAGALSTPDASAWLRTGDLGEIRDDGVLYFKGRKKDVIVLADGLNVFPVDVEAALNRRPEIREAVVVGRASERGDIVHAVLIVTSGRADDAVRVANSELETHQRIQEWTVWPDPDFPRTASTLKIKRHEILERLTTPSLPQEHDGIRDLVARQLGRPRDELGENDRLSDELGLTSLDRVELLTNLERKLGKELSETDLSRVETLAELEAWAADAPPPSPERSPLSGLARYGRIAPIRFVRSLFREVVIRPLFRHYLPLTVEGDLHGVQPPVIFAANHQSNLDTLAVLTAMPYSWRRSIAPIVQQEYFDAYLEKGAGNPNLRETIWAAIQYWLAIVLVNTFPLPRSGTGTRPTMRFAGALIDKGYSILIFPEGRLTRDGEMGSFKSGVGLLARRLGLPVVPIHLDGLFEILPFDQRWPKAGPVRVRIGEPIRFQENESFDEATRRVEDSLRSLGRRSG